MNKKIKLETTNLTKVNIDFQSDKEKIEITAWEDSNALSGESLSIEAFLETHDLPDLILLEQKFIDTSALIKNSIENAKQDLKELSKQLIILRNEHDLLSNSLKILNDEKILQTGVMQEITRKLESIEGQFKTNADNYKVECESIEKKTNNEIAKIHYLWSQPTTINKALFPSWEKYGKSFVN